jgi:hypothetical protein
VAHAEQIGFGEVIDLGIRAVEGLPGELVYAGFSLGVLPAQKLAQTHTILKSLERPAVVEVGRMDGVPGAAQLVGEVDNARRRPKA